MRREGGGNSDALEGPLGRLILGGGHAQLALVTVSVEGVSWGGTAESGAGEPPCVSVCLGAGRAR